MKTRAKNQNGWTTMEYVVGAIILIGVITVVIQGITGAIQKQGTAVQQKIEAAN